MRSRTLFGVLAGVLAVGGSVVFGIGATSQGGGATGPKLMSSMMLPDGAEQDVWSDGTITVGTPGYGVAFTASKQGYQVAMTPPDPGTSAGTVAMARTYKAEGRSPAQDARDLGRAPTRQELAASKKARLSGDVIAAACTAGNIFDSGNLTINDSHAYLYGAYRRYTTCDSDPNNHYTYEESQLSGYGKNPCDLISCSMDTMRTQHSYGNGSLIKWAPGGDMTPSGSSCQTQTTGLSAYGVSVSESVSVCPDKIHPLPSTRSFYAQWQGCTHNGSTKAAAANSSQKLANTVSANFSYVIYYHWSYC